MPSGATVIEDSSSRPGSGELSSGRMHRILRAASPYLTTILVSLIVLGSIYHPWKRNLRIPLDATGDAYFYQMVVKNFVETGHYYVNPSLAAPGQQELYDFPQPNWTHLVTLAVLRLFTHNYGLVLNLFFLLAFPLAALTTCYALRQMGISSGFAVMGAVLFAFLPIHILRSQHHLFFTTLYLVPPACLAAFWLANGKPLFGFELAPGSGSRTLITTDGAIALLSCVLIAGDNPYNAFFAASFLLVAGLLGSCRSGHRRALLSAIVLSAVVTVVLLIELLPNLLYLHMHGRTAVGQRFPVESEVFGLTLIQLLSPVNSHILPALAHWRTYYDSHAVLVNENGTASLGVLGVIGFFISLAALFRRQPSAPLYSLGILNLWGVLFGTIGGFGAVFAFLISPQIRSYNRISIFIGFFSIAALAWALDRGWRSRFHRFGITGLILAPALLLLIGVLDQLPRHSIWPNSFVKRTFREQQAFIGQIENAVPTGSTIFQLPYMFFPEHGDLNKMVDYDPLVGYLHSKSLRWSYGAPRYRPTDLWQKDVAAEPTPQMIDSLRAAGFAGIFVDRFGYTDNAAAVERELRALLKSDPITDATGRYIFFRIDR